MADMADPASFAAQASGIGRVMVETGTCACSSRNHRHGPSW